jgi:hypothetical protein
MLGFELTPKQRYELAKFIHDSLGISIGTHPFMDIEVSEPYEMDRVYLSLGDRIYTSIQITDEQLVEMARQIMSLHDSYHQMIQLTLNSIITTEPEGKDETD